MENTLENKSKIFALYWGQEVCRLLNDEGVYVIFDPQKILDVIIDGYCETAHLYLTSINQITDEHAFEVAKIFRWTMYSDESKLAQVKKFLNEHLDSHSTNISAIEYFELLDFLRSKGYYIGNGSEIYYGWVILKE